MLGALVGQLTAYTTLDVDDAIARWADGRFAVLVDVRTQSEWDDGHLPNATFIESMNTNGDTSRLDGCQSCPVAVYCRSGRRSKDAADILEANGFTEVYDVLGINQWTAAGVELVNTADFPPGCDAYTCEDAPSNSSSNSNSNSNSNSSSDSSAAAAQPSAQGAALGLASASALVLARLVGRR